MERMNYELATPNAASLIQSLRAFGYDITTAIADLIDNSITANASEIHIQFTWGNDNKPWITISDNGNGMTENELFEAMKPGSKSPLDIRNDKDLGRFGLGLKTASFSQCRRLTVITKTTKTNIALRCWDLDFVSKNNDWTLLKEGTATANKVASVFFKNRANGTIVLWEKLDRIVPSQFVDKEKYQNAFLDFAKNVEKHISLVFSGYMRGKNKLNFYINGNHIELWDPFMTDNSFTSMLPVEQLYVDGDLDKKVTVRAFTLPHYSKLSDQEYKYGEGINGWNKIKTLLKIIEETIPVPAIISNYTDNDKDTLNPFEKAKSTDKTEKLDLLIEQVYQMYLNQGFSSTEAIEAMAGTEPFIYIPEKIQLFSEKLKEK